MVILTAIIKANFNLMPYRKPVLVHVEAFESWEDNRRCQLWTRRIVSALVIGFVAGDALHNNERDLMAPTCTSRQTVPGSQIIGLVNGPGGSPGM